MKLDGTMDDLFYNIDPQHYEEYFTMENRKKVLYVRLDKYLYVTVHDTLLLYQKLSRKLKEWVF